jgi:hypothetical protein
MPPESNQAVPFVSLGGFLREDFLQRLLRQAIEFASTASAPCGAALTRLLGPIPVPGFRQFLRAPRGLQVRAATSRFQSSDAFVGRVLEAWLEANRPLADLGARFLEAQGIPCQRIQAEEEQFRSRWSLDEVLRLADLFCAEHPSDQDDVALLLCCLSGRAPVADAPVPADVSPAAETPVPSGAAPVARPTPVRKEPSPSASAEESAHPLEGAAPKASRGQSRETAKKSVSPKGKSGKAQSHPVSGNK